MIDSHCHLNYIDKCGTVTELVDEAVKAGVRTIINIGADLESSQTSVDLARQLGPVWATVGVHPHDASTVDDDVVDKVKSMTSEKKVVAVGEIGLDYYRDLSPRKVQRKVFRRFLELAVEVKLPVVIHTREAFEDTVEIVGDYAGDLRGGVFHCFPGSVDDAQRVFELGFSISVGGVITYRDSRMARVAAEVPLDRIIAETDAPYLTPVPFRGKTNRPALVRHVYEKLAELRGIDKAELEKRVDRNCQKLFGLVEVFGG
ncbi:MAG: TatD family hydrolase [Candidatus Zixiibacteriota bacterium]|nr:MAG: TatD family hydrolase [candidate division Zixibacteria bacterium]